MGYSDAITAEQASLLNTIHYYILIYHYRHFHCRSDRSDGVILAPSVRMIVQTSTSDGLMIDVVVVLGLHLLHRMKS
jgi:hypothetical protein